MTYSAEDFIASPAYMDIAVEEACKTMAKIADVEPEEVKKAYMAGAENVVKTLDSLIYEAAARSAEVANEKGL